MPSLRIFFAGVGGQGTLTATRLVAETALDQGLEVTAGEIHGMAQRGGVVHSFVLMGGYHSPKISAGEADILLGFEPLETVRALPFLKPGGVVLSSDSPVPPVSTTTGKETYPSLQDCRAKIEACTDRLHLLPCVDLARKTNVVQTANTVLLGGFFAGEFSPVTLEAFLENIQNKLSPKLVDVNLQAARLGADFING